MIYVEYFQNEIKHFGNKSFLRRFDPVWNEEFKKMIGILQEIQQTYC